MLRIATLVALAGVAAAQIPGLESLSEGCTRTITTVLADPEVNACLAPSALLAVATGSNDTSIIGPVNTWLGNMCSAVPCSNATLASIVSNVTTGCAQDLALDDPATAAASITPMVQQYYPGVRSIACLRDGDTNCVTKTLTTLEGAIGPLSINNLMSVALTGNGIEKLSPSMLCTDCIKAAYNIVNTQAPSLIGEATPLLQSQCGAPFVDGTTPATITQSNAAAGTGSNNTNTGAGNNNNGASALSTGLVSALGVASIVAALL